MNSGITLVEVRKEAMDTINQLRSKTIDAKTASEIRNLLNTVIDTAKVQIEFIKVIPNSIKEKMSVDQLGGFIGNAKSKEEELDETLAEIKKKENTYVIKH